jgi:hypothetical protein
MSMLVPLATYQHKPGRQITLDCICVSPLHVWSQLENAKNCRKVGTLQICPFLSSSSPRDRRAISVTEKGGTLQQEEEGEASILTIVL